MFVRGNRVRDSVASRVMGRNFTSGILEIRPTLPGQKERERRVGSKTKGRIKGKEKKTRGKLREERRDAYRSKGSPSPSVRVS